MKQLLFILLSFISVYSVCLKAQVLSIAEVQGYGPASPYVNQVVTIKGAVTGVYSAGYFIRDNDQAWSGMYIYDSGHKPLLGDTIQLTARVSEYYEWTELSTVTSFTIISTGNPIPEPVLIYTGDIDESWENCLVTVKSAKCTKTPATLGYGEWEVDDGSSPTVVNDLGYAYTPQIDVKYNITGNVSFSFSFYKIEPRFAADVEIAATIFINSEVYPDTIGKNELVLSWTTNFPGSTEALWGLTPGLELGSSRDTAKSINHSVKIKGLSPAGFYYVRPFSVNGFDTTFSKPVLFSTSSESSGDIRVCFNRSVIPAKEGEMQGIYTSSMIDTMVRYVNLAQNTLDLAIYDFTNHADTNDVRNLALVEAINSAYHRGVTVRFITDNNVSNKVLENLDPNVPLLKVRTTAIMHDKFIIADRESTSNSWLVSGSTNPTVNNLVMDFNNLLAIQDQSLAKAYTLEFNEMYGSSGEFPDTINYKISSNKKDNTPHHFLVGDKRVEVYFSPTDFTTNHIVQQLDKATSRIDFSMMAFTEDLLGNALVNAVSRGINVRGEIDYIEYSGSEYSKLLSAGLEVLDYKNPGGTGWPDAPTLHHKFAVVDAGSADAVVITGSHNWTASAESKNDENTLIIHDTEIANLYKAESDRIYKWLWPLDCYDDSITLFDQTTGNIKVLDNDSINGNVNISIIKEPLHGTAKLEADKSISYEAMNPDAAVTHDTIIYQLCYENDAEYCEQAYVFITVNSSASVSISGKETLSIYPNPVYNELHVISASPVQSVEISDLSGKIILRSKPLKTDFIMQVPGPKGLYIMNLQTASGETIFKKLIKL